MRRAHCPTRRVLGSFQKKIKLSHLEGKTFEFEGNFSAEASRGLVTQHAYYYARLEDPYWIYVSLRKAYTYLPLCCGHMFGIVTFVPVLGASEF